MKNNLNATICDKTQLKLLLKKKKKLQKKKQPISVHIKVNTGMNRVGVHFSEALKFIEEVYKEKDIRVNGVYTHLATSDETDKEYAKLQLERFTSLINELKVNNIDFGKAHCAKTAVQL